MTEEGDNYKTKAARMQRDRQEWDQKVKGWKQDRRSYIAVVYVTPALVIAGIIVTIFVR